MNPLPRVHAWVDRAGWDRPALDRLARIRSRGSLPLVQRPARPMSGDGLVSVVIPCFNYGRFLPAAVASALDQQDVEVEVIVVDDASTDDSLAVARRLAAGETRVQVVALEANSGHVRAFNHGLAVASGRFLVRLDADDLLTPGSLARSVALMVAEPTVGLVYGHPAHFATPVPPPPRVGRVTWTVWSGAEWVAERCRRGVNCITTPEAMLRSSVVEQVGPLDERLRFAQDMEMWLRVAAVSDVGHVNNVDQALHRDHASSMSVTDAAGPLTDLEERRTVFEHLFDGVGGSLPSSEALREQAARSLADEALRSAVFRYDRGAPDDATVDGLVGFARETHPEADRLPAARVLRRYQADPGRRRGAASLLRVVSSRLDDEWSHLRWTRVGL